MIGIAVHRWVCPKPVGIAIRVRPRHPPLGCHELLHLKESIAPGDEVRLPARWIVQIVRRVEWMVSEIVGVWTPIEPAATLVAELVHPIALSCRDDGVPGCVADANRIRRTR